MKTCVGPKCENTVIKARGMCGLHYDRWYRGGDPGFEVPAAWVTAGICWPYCACADMMPQPVVLFGGMELLDVTECCRCHRPSRPAGLVKVSA